MRHVEEVYIASPAKGVTIKYPGEKGAPVYVTITHQQYAWLRWIRRLYEQGEFSDDYVRVA